MGNDLHGPRHRPLPARFADAPRAAAELADQARLAAGTRPTAAATLAAADALMNRLPQRERSDTWLTYSEQKHHVHLSHAYTTLADTAVPTRASSAPWSCPRRPAP